MENEIWRPVKNYETYYEVSSYGRVRSVDRIVTYSNGRKHLHKGKIIKPAKVCDGYLQIQLWKSGKVKQVLIHRLVAQAFLPNPDNLPQVNHKDENKTNNRVFLNKDGSVELKKSNLEWCDGKYNVNYGTAIKRMREKKLNSPKLSKPVLQIDLETNQIIAEYPSVAEALRQLNISQGHISECCRGERKTYKGFKWCYEVF